MPKLKILNPICPILRGFHRNLIPLLTRRLPRIVHHLAPLHMRPLTRLHMPLIRPLTNPIEIPTHMLRFWANRHLRPRNPLPRGRARVRMAEDIASDRLEAVVDVVPFAEIDGAVGIDH